MLVLNYKIVIGSLFVYKLQLIHPKNEKKIKHESNKLCMFQTRRKSGSVKKNKNNFINVTGDKFATSIFNFKPAIWLSLLEVGKYLRSTKAQ